ncbi:MAG: hypothetical protein IJQ31_13490 [Thermoguttaceae bacterium]|nr:hypothetical protein [Thermoguttaceae bacterium]
MKPSTFLLFLFLLAFPLLALAQDCGTFYAVDFEPSQTPGELIYASHWRIWIPDGVPTLRGVIMHQHGCGDGSSKPGHTAVEDWHWQALARKYDCALMAVSYAQTGPCEMWCNPMNGSAKCFLRALDNFAQETGHAELSVVPWAIWGHSGGGQWTSSMVQLYPGRIACAWARSGHPNTVGMTLQWLPLPKEVCDVPYVLNLGVREKTEFKKIWDEGFPYVQKLRAMGARASIVMDPETGHCCGNQRYTAIAFFDACLAQRLPEKAGTADLRPMKTGVVLSADEIWKEFQASEKIREITQDPENPESPLFVGEKIRACIGDGFWFPTEEFVETVRVYQRTGMIEDRTPPPAPFDVKTVWKDGPDGADGTKTAEVTWKAWADPESGLAEFIIERDGQEAARFRGPHGSVGRPLFQGLLYSDTPGVPTPELKFTENVPAGETLPVYRVRSVNACGGVSE